MVSIIERTFPFDITPNIFKRKQRSWFPFSYSKEQLRGKFDALLNLTILYNHLDRYGDKAVIPPGRLCIRGVISTARYRPAVAPCCASSLRPVPSFPPFQACLD